MYNSKEIVHLQGLLVLTVVYLYILEQSITILLKGILFIGCLHYLPVHFYSCFYIQYHGGIREITSMSL